MSKMAELNARGITNMYDYIEGRVDGKAEVVKLIERQICFDALADSQGRCENHGGKCYELRQLIDSLSGKNLPERFRDKANGE